MELLTVTREEDVAEVDGVVRVCQDLDEGGFKSTVLYKLEDIERELEAPVEIRNTYQKSAED
ncbi:MAG: hypothetical protein ABEI13_01085, partial [Candidatus Paceibacteria bacterium]